MAKIDGDESDSQTSRLHVRGDRMPLLTWPQIPYSLFWPLLQISLHRTGSSLINWIKESQKNNGGIVIQLKPFSPRTTGKVLSASPPS